MTHINDNPFELGKAYLIRTVTYFWTGRVVRVYPQFMVLEDAAWIADTGRYSDASTEEALEEVEPREGPVIVSLGAIVDAVEWTSDLPRLQK